MNFVIIVKKYLNFGNDFKNAYYGSPFFNKSVKFTKECALFWAVRNRKHNPDIKNDFYDFWAGYFHGYLNQSVCSFHGMCIRKYGKSYLDNFTIQKDILYFIEACFTNRIVPPLSEDFIDDLAHYPIRGLMQCGIKNIPIDYELHMLDAVECGNIEYLDKCTTNYIQNTLRYKCININESMVEYLQKRNIVEYCIKNPQLAIKNDQLNKLMEICRTNFEEMKEIAQYVDVSKTNVKQLYERIIDKNTTNMDLLYIAKTL